MPRSTVTRITIARLFNLGSYEHIRYEVTVEVPEGRSASSALIGLETVLSRLSPKRPVGTPSTSELATAFARLERLKTLSDEEFKVGMKE